MKITSFLLAACLSTSVALAGESVIVEEGGSACREEQPGKLLSRLQTEEAARTAAKRYAADRVASRVRSQTSSITGELGNGGRGDGQAYKIGQVLVSAYAQAQVKVLETAESSWYKDPSFGACYSVRLRCEVVPEPEAMQSLGTQLQDDPTLPLNVRIWTERSKAGETPTYHKGEALKLFLRGNKPFYGRIVYHMADGNTLQILPNPYRQDNYFQGGVTYEVPTGQDKFALEIDAPYGVERVVVYASQQPLGEVKVAPAGGVFLVDAKAVKKLGIASRGVKLVATPQGAAQAGKAQSEPAEFSEFSVNLTTQP